MHNGSVRAAILEEYGTKQCDPESQLLSEELHGRGIPFSFVPLRHIVRRRVTVRPDVLVAGSIPFVLAGLHQLGLRQPEFNEYPQCLSDLLCRQSWFSTLGDFQLTAGIQPSRAFFLKPYRRRKSFAGFVYPEMPAPDDLAKLSRRMEIVCFDVVDWVSEFRYFVVHNRVVGCRAYKGDETHVPQRQVVDQAIGTLAADGWQPVAYAADFGVLRDGRTALVEVNDGWSLGHWGLDKAPYTDLIIARWCQMTAGSRVLPR